MNKILFGVSLIGFVFSFIFVLISVWNNTDWLLLERGYYTFGVITIGVTVYIAIQHIIEYKTATVLGKVNIFVITAFAIVSVIFMAISVRNTEWILLEKGYYWMGIAFVTITAAMLSSTISSVVDNSKHE